MEYPDNNSKNKFMVENGFMDITHINPKLYDGDEFKTKYWEPPVDYRKKDPRKTENDADDSDSDSMDSTGHKKSFSRICVRFAEKTSMQGVPYINTAKLKLAKIAWSILVVVFLGVMIFHLWYLVDQFFSYPKQTKISLGFDNLEYPAITICNVNVIRKSELHNTLPELNGLVQAVDPQRFKRPPPPSSIAGSPDSSSGTGNSGQNQPTTQSNSGSRGPSSGTGNSRRTQNAPQGRRKRFVQDLRNINFNNYSQDKDYNDFNQKGGVKSPIFELLETFEDLYMKHNRSTRVKVGHSLDDMLISCSFNGYECYADNFTVTNHPAYGNCYTLYSEEYKAEQSGPKYGFSIDMYTETEEYLDGITQGYGARVIIHPKGTFPFPEDEGLFAPSGWETDIGLKLIEVERLDGNYGNCNTGVDFTNEYNITYTRRTCQLVCEQNALIKDCGCVDKMKQELFNKAQKRHKFCASPTELECMQTTLTKYITKQIPCDCENPCIEKQYQSSTSSRQWPTEAYATTLLQGVCENMPRKCTYVETLDSTVLSRNFIKLTVYYDDLNYELIKEDPEIEGQQFASDVGGAIGLWIGLSMLSMFEVFQLLCEMCQYGCHRCTRKDKVNRTKRQHVGKKSAERTLADIRHNSKGRFDTYPRDPQYPQKR